MKMFEVGGAVRDGLLGLVSKDRDFAVEAESFDAMKSALEALGFEFFVVTPEFLTLRARFPKAMRTEKNKGLTADFGLCRKDSTGSDGRRPDFVEPGTILDDLARRDFTVNAMAVPVDPVTAEPVGSLLDPFGGREDLERGVLRFVGDPATRVTEDGLRVLRALRFVLTKGFALTGETRVVLGSELAATMLRRVSVERVREELFRMAKADSWAMVDTLATFPLLRQVVREMGVKLEPTLKSL